jgi:putative nucleotidyltransferase with HDIG domain
VVDRETIDRQIDRMSKLPILPQILVRLNQVASDSGSSAEDLGKVILKDQSLTLRILKVVNSAYYQRRGREQVTTVSKAVVLIGFNGVRRLALGMSVCDTLRSADELPGMERFWAHSLATAITARLLAELSGHPSKEEAFVAGLVHDIGKLVLARCEPELYARLLAEHGSDGPLRAAERQAFGLSHAQAGKKLARRWGLPGALEEVIGDHHGYESTGLGGGLPLLLRIVIAANRFSPGVLAPPDDAAALEVARLLDEALDVNGLEAEVLYENVVQEYTDLAQTFGVPALPPQSENWVSRVARPEVDRDELLARLADVAAAMAAGEEPERLAGRILEGILAAVALDRLFLLVPDGAAGLVCRAGRSQGSRPALTAFAPLSSGSSAAWCGEALRRPLHVPDIAAAPPAELPGAEIPELLGVTSFATLPVTFRGRPLGVLWLDNPTSGRPLSATVREAVAPLAHQLALVLAEPHVPAGV